jgi:hypothetical protein
MKKLHVTKLTPAERVFTVEKVGQTKASGPTSGARVGTLGRVLVGTNLVVGGRIEGIGEGLLVGRRVGKKVAEAMQRREAPKPPLELNPLLHVHMEEPTEDPLCGGQGWH